MTEAQRQRHDHLGRRLRELAPVIDRLGLQKPATV